ncbi:uncharacterized protein LOC128208400 [Mya arenaria]|uniref:uncharacterized protein LOC128208400 n=1 Tax=Mya arenaria TaxID=6604 RepID=UPI0022E72470|nr:uncharacterized protein LOC128208400 [Mya arenaria]
MFALLMLEFWKQVNGDLGMYDYQVYMVIDPTFLLAAEDDRGEVLGFGGVSKNSPDTVYLGNFIVRDDVRGRGIGRQIWRAMIDKAGDMNIALDSEPYMVDYYGKNGFMFKTFKVAFYNVEMLETMKGNASTKYKIKTLTEDMWPLVMAYDRQVYPSLDRERILRAWFGVGDVRGVVAIDQGTIVGYGCIHKKEGKQYGLRNVFADSEEVLEAMLRDMFAVVPVGYVVRFMKVDGKPMPKFIQHSVDADDSALRMFNKFKIETNEEKMWFASAHIL